MTEAAATAVLDALEAQMGVEIDAVFAELGLSFDNPGPAEQYVIESYPAVVAPYAAAAGDVAAVWYDSAAPGLKYSALPAEPPGIPTLQSSVVWAYKHDAALDLLKGSAQRTIWDTARRTIVDNANREDGARWARVARPNACRFCQMLATRGPVYSSRSSAGRTSDPNALMREHTTRYHRNCHCITVPVRPGDEYHPPAYAKRWTAEYEAARKLSASGDVKDIMAAYRLMDTTM